MPLTDDDRLTLGRSPRDARAVVLLLHGGAERGQRPGDTRSLAFRRTRWMFRTIADDLAEAGAQTALLRFTVKGWNAGRGTEPSPVADARAALDLIADRYADLGVVLLGHSMGARTAARVADHPAVIGVVGLAPWLPPDDPVEPLAGRHLVAAHGSHDRITSARATRRYVDRARPVAASARFVDMGPLGHYMVKGLDRWNATAVAETIGMLDRT
jgi:alpha-beta hydrolase superfamily lysophospholipase